jgi:flagellar biosynthesis anti-sigma factor FlgM
MKEDEKRMKVTGDQSAPLTDEISYHAGITIPRQAYVNRHRERLVHADQLSLSPKLRGIQQAGQMLAQIVDVRETRVVELQRDVENGHYAVEAEQVAERIVKNHLLDLLD